MEQFRQIIPGDRVKLNSEGVRFFNKYRSIFFTDKIVTEYDVFTVVNNKIHGGFLKIMDNKHKITNIIYSLLIKVESGQMSLPFKNREDE